MTTEIKNTATEIKNLRTDGDYFRHEERDTSEIPQKI
jgi:hypothetical protein